MSGDLELIDDSVEDGDENKTPLRKRDLEPYGKAFNVKKRLETQLKSIIKTHSASNQRLNEHSKISFDLPRIKSSKKEDLLKQVANHSFKDIDLIKIQPCSEQIDFRTVDVPVLNTTYKVNVLKKPFSMKWLFFRRLSLFLQSDLYNEFKLAMILLQCQILDNESSKYLFYIYRD